MGEAPTRRPRQQRSLRNDARILDAALMVAATDGWHHLSAQRLAHEVGLSTPAVLGRYRSGSQIAAALWQQRLVVPLTESLERVVAACPSPGLPAAPAVLSDALLPFAFPDATMRATAEILVLARYDDCVGRAVQSTLAPELERWIAPRARSLTRAQAARHAHLITIALGMVMVGPIVTGLADMDLDDQFNRLAAALSTDSKPHRLPSQQASHLHAVPDVDADDPVQHAVLCATLSEVGERGYEAATLLRIAHAAGYSPGVIHSRYASKRDLFIDASARSFIASVDLNRDYERRITEQHSSGTADACLVREFMRPGGERMRTVYIEQVRLARHDPDLYAAIAGAVATVSAELENAVSDTQPPRDPAHNYIGWARGVGVCMLAELHSDAWALPYDVVLIPLLDG